MIDSFNLSNDEGIGKDFFFRKYELKLFCVCAAPRCAVPLPSHSANVICLELVSNKF